ncbi:hypothetical protein F902_00554 [Acinetobacter higginsii]|uniref:Uncharacterized protein n=1 Tax=Acinetobacter higginsii TaxID=70347 RepID=N9TE96_9GAMM|nr:hypothetical protein F991_00120 [Acinetobacter sp. CIP-A165]ENX61730.1 hypothetical protein F902_00554 [Acinetobacter higginsii]
MDFVSFNLKMKGFHPFFWKYFVYILHNKGHYSGNLSN